MTQPPWIRPCIVAACCACSMAAASAATVTLTFDHIGDEGPYLDSYTESGFLINSLYPDGPHLHAGDAALLLHSGEGSSPYQIRLAGGGSFDFLGFAYSGGDSVFVSDTGATFSILGDQPLATFTLPASFHNVTYIDWYMNTPGDVPPDYVQWGSIDNVVMNVAAVPEPAQAAMLGLGLAGLLLHGRRSQRRQARARKVRVTIGPHTHDPMPD